MKKRKGEAGTPPGHRRRDSQRIITLPFIAGISYRNPPGVYIEHPEGFIFSSKSNSNREESRNDESAEIR
jgi:hypothetical protein